MLKAAAGGGGKGMREVICAEDLPEAFRRAHSEAVNAFGNGDIYMEKRVVKPRHVEVQVMADTTAMSFMYSNETARFSVVIKRWLKRRHAQSFDLKLEML